MIVLFLAAGIAFGLLSGWVFRSTADMSAALPICRRIHARFLEFRLFFDEPRLIWRAQKSLVRDNFRLCALFLKPSLILALPTVWLMFQLNAVYGVAPLRVGEATVVTAQPVADSQAATLEAPAGIVVESPPVHITSEHQVVWRIRPLRPVTGVLRFTIGGVTLTRAISAAERGTFFLHRREGGAVWMEVDYPAAARWWIVWFLAISTTTTVVFARR